MQVRLSVLLEVLHPACCLQEFGCTPWHHLQEFGSAAWHCVVQDYVHLQGLRVEEELPLDWVGAGLKEKKFAGMMGNAMSGNVLEFVIPCVLQAAGLITAKRFREMQAASVARWGLPQA